MYQKLSEEEIEFMEFYHDPVTVLENVMPVNLKAPSQWNEDCECIRLRPYQFPMIAYDYLYEEDSSKTKKQNMDIRKNAGIVYNISGRNIGKSFIGFIGDAILAILHYSGIESCLSSFDDFHVKKICEPIVNLVENHKLFKLFHIQGNKKSISRSPFGVQTQSGHYMVGVNENIAGKNPGTGYHSLHYERFLYDEASYISKEGSEKRVDSISSNGCIERLFGIPALAIGSPLGNILSNPKNKPFICRLPQYVRADWDDDIAEKQADQYGGRNSTAYKLNVEGELLEGAFGKYDMDRIRKKCLKTDEKIRFFEISTKIFKDINTARPTKDDYEELNSRLCKKIVIDRVPCDQIIIASDIGTSKSPSEVTIFFRKDKKWYYKYQISLFNMIIKEQTMFFKWLYDKLGTAFVILDCTNIDGGTIRQSLIDQGINENHLPNFRMNENITVDFEIDQETGKPKRGSNGKPIPVMENTKEFGVMCLEEVLYAGTVEIPYDEKFLKEMSGFLEIVTGHRKKYSSTTTDHLHDSFLLFALGVWSLKDKKNFNIQPTKRCLGVI